MVTVWRRSTAAEMCWTGSSGPAGIPVVPLVWQDLPCVALPLAHLDAVDTMTSGRAAFAVTGPGDDEPGADGLVATGPVDIRFDLEGTRFVDHLLEQEIVKHPPTRLRADGIMARRENWWWVPRVLITLTAEEEVREVPARRRGADALLVRTADAGGAPRVDTVTAPAWPDRTGAETELWRRDGAALQGAGEPAFAFGHRHSPDFERWERWYRSGRTESEALTVAEATGAPEPEPLQPYSFFARYRNHRDVVRACRRGVAEAEARAGRG
nr:hypothetical protein [Streptomonospora salina]